MEAFDDGTEKIYESMSRCRKVSTGRKEHQWRKQPKQDSQSGQMFQWR